MIPRVVHFVFGLEEQHEPFHFVHYVAVESARRVVQPDAIYFHHKHLPWGPWWDRIAPFVTLVPVDLVPDVLRSDYSVGFVPPSYRYAHHADFIRLGALIEYGGIYADIDTVFVHPIPDAFFNEPFVIGAESPNRDELTGELRPSLCNALLMAEPNAAFARAWLDQMPQALNGTWSNHSGFLAQSLSEELPSAVHVEPAQTFFPFSSDPSGLAQLFLERHDIANTTVSVHLWAHLWWDRTRRDFSTAHAGWCTPSSLRRAGTTMAALARPYLPESPKPDGWIYLSLDETSGYGIAAGRCRDALEDSGQEVDWAALVTSSGGRFGYEIPALLNPFRTSGDRLGREQVIVAHLVPEYFPLVRRQCEECFLVGHTVWETDRIPEHWIPCLDTADLLVVPSRFSADAIECSPVSTPVAVVPHVAPQGRASTSRLWNSVPPDRYVFYTVGEWNERKGLSFTIEAYLRAFNADDPVLLIVKTASRDLRVRRPSSGRIVEEGSTAWSLARILAHHPDHAAITLVTRELPDDVMTALHVRGDCFVSLCRSEGWGLGAFDAAALGNPVVTTGFGGHLEYLAGSPYLVDYTLVHVVDSVGYPSYAPDQRWAEPDVDHGARVLRDVWQHRKEAARMASSLAGDIRWRFRPEAVAMAFRQAVEAHLNSR